VSVGSNVRQNDDLIRHYGGAAVTLPGRI
jgi:hypothetical protein